MCIYDLWVQGVDVNQAVHICTKLAERPPKWGNQSRHSAIRIHSLANEHPLSCEPWELQSNFSNKVFSLKTVDKSSHQARKKKKGCESTVSTVHAARGIIYGVFALV